MITYLHIALLVVAFLVLRGKWFSACVMIIIAAKIGYLWLWPGWHGWLLSGFIEHIALALIAYPLLKKNWVLVAGLIVTLICILAPIEMCVTSFAAWKLSYLFTKITLYVCILPLWNNTDVVSFGISRVSTVMVISEVLKVVPQFEMYLLKYADPLLFAVMVFIWIYPAIERLCVGKLALIGGGNDS